MSAVMQLRAALLRDDPELASDEAELQAMLAADPQGADAVGLLRTLVRVIIIAENRSEAAGVLIGKLKARAERYENRAARMRETVLAAMQALGIPKLEDADFTVTKKRGPPAVTITDESKLSDEYVRIVPEKREPDKATIKGDLSIGVVVEGAQLSNGADILAIKTT